MRSPRRDAPEILPRSGGVGYQREALGASGELHWRLPSLSVPPAGPLPPIERLPKYGSVRLLVERARFRQPAFELTQENAPAVLQICRRLEGIPLAIELAVARVSALPLDQIVVRLDNSLGLLTGEGDWQPVDTRPCAACSTGATSF